MKARDRSPWHRDDLPPWAWAAIVVMRVAQVVAALVPLALLVLLGWGWAHRGDPQVRQALRSAANQAGALADSVRSVLR